jgi:GT2 family glycosyltransferase
VKRDGEVAIIVLNWNQLQITRQCLNSIPAADDRWQVFLVDNGSRDDQRADATSIPWARVTHLTSPTNLGFTGGANLGIRAAMREGFQNLLLLNNDARLLPGALDELRRRMVPGVAAVCPMIVDGRTGRVWSVGGRIGWCRGLTSGSFNGRDPRDVPSHDWECDFGTAACLMIASDAVRQVGLLDDTYFAYWEETDWCVRAARANLRIVACPRAKVEHDGGVSTTSQTRLYFLLRNCILFMRRHASRAQLATFLIFFSVWTIPAWSIRPFVANPLQTMRAVLRAVGWHVRRPVLPAPSIRLPPESGEH